VDVRIARAVVAAEAEHVAAAEPDREVEPVAELPKVWAPDRSAQRSGSLVDISESLPAAELVSEQIAVVTGSPCQHSAAEAAAEQIAVAAGLLSEHSAVLAGLPSARSVALADLPSEHSAAVPAVAERAAAERAAFLLVEAVRSDLAAAIAATFRSDLSALAVANFA
jgi:hypothetical protein